MPVTDQLKNQHLLWRAGFGPAVDQLDDLSNSSPQKLYRALQKSSSKKPEYLQAADNYLQGLMMGFQEAGRQLKEMSPEQKKELMKKSRESIRNLNLYWVNEMVNSDAQLREKCLCSGMAISLAAILIFFFSRNYFMWSGGMLLEIFVIFSTRFPGQERC